MKVAGKAKVKSEKPSGKTEWKREKRKSDEEHASSGIAWWLADSVNSYSVEGSRWSTDRPL